MDEDVLLKRIYSKSTVEQFIVSLNTEGQPTSQLYALGVDANGNQLEPPYTVNTIQFKLNGFGDSRIDHVTLKDTGDFYESFIVKALKDGFEITANPIKGGNDLTEKYGEDIIGISEQNKEILSQFLQPFLEEEIRNAILQ